MFCSKGSLKHLRFVVDQESALGSKANFSNPLNFGLLYPQWLSETLKDASGPVDVKLAEALGLLRHRDLFMWTVEALKEWHDFYMLVGTAGATLLALLFVAVSLGVGFLTEERQSAANTFMSPVVVHFTSVFFLSAVALCPWHQAKFFAALIGVTALVGAILSTYITIRVVRTDMTNYVEDYLAYGLLPGLGYLALLGAAVSIYLEKDFGLHALAGALLLLAVVNIRNAWDLTLTMVRRHRRAD